MLVYAQSYIILNCIIKSQKEREALKKVIVSQFILQKEIYFLRVRNWQTAKQ